MGSPKTNVVLAEFAMTYQALLDMSLQIRLFNFMSAALQTSAYPYWG